MSVSRLAGFCGPLPPARFNMARYCIGAQAAILPDKPALLVIADAASGRPVEIWSYRDLEQAVLRAGGALRAEGLRPGDRIMLQLENSSAYAILFFGAIAAGLVPLPASSQLTLPEARFVLDDSKSAAIVLDSHRPFAGISTPQRQLDETWTARAIADGPRLEAYADTGREDEAYVIYTSGTTARPKGVRHAQRAAWGRRPMYQGWYGIGASDRMLHAGAFNWTYTLGTGLSDPWANGATSIVYTGPRDPEVWPRLIRSHEASLFAAVPSLYRQVLKYAGAACTDLASLRHGLTAGEALAETVVSGWRDATGKPLYEALGMSEISTYVSSGPGVPRKPGAVGRAQPGRAIAILPEDGDPAPLAAGETGLLAVHRSDPGLMLGYLDRPEEEAEVLRGDWFTGGDLASIDAEGYVTHYGRANELMKGLGYRVSPLEVEAVLARHPAVAEVACAEIAVAADVSVIGAFVVVREGQSIDAEAVKAHAAGELAPYKVPREVVLVPALPHTANGKVRRAELPAIFAEMRERAR